MFDDSASWGWLVDDDKKDDTTGEVSMSIQQMVGANNETDKISLYKHSIFQKQQMSAETEKVFYPDNPKFLDGNIEINIPKEWPYDSGYHVLPSRPKAQAQAQAPLPQ